MNGIKKLEYFVISTILFICFAYAISSFAGNPINKFDANGQSVLTLDPGDDDEIILYDGTTLTRLTDNDYLDRGAQLTANGEVVWYGSNSTFTFGPIIPGGGLDLSGMFYGGGSGGCMISSAASRSRETKEAFLLALLCFCFLHLPMIFKS